MQEKNNHFSILQHECMKVGTFYTYIIQWCSHNERGEDQTGAAIIERGEGQTGTTIIERG